MLNKTFGVHERKSRGEVMRMWAKGPCYGHFMCDRTITKCGTKDPSRKGEIEACACASGHIGATDTGCVWTRASVDRDVDWVMCTYHLWKDRFISGHIQHNGVWEREYVSFMLRQLAKHNGSQLLDIGANIGMYSLAAAVAGHHVVAIEPWAENTAMLLQSAQRNGLMERLQLYQVAASDRHGFLQLGLPDQRNHGSASQKGGESGKTAFVSVPSMPIGELLAPLSKACGQNVPSSRRLERKRMAPSKLEKKEPKMSSRWAHAELV